MKKKVLIFFAACLLAFAAFAITACNFDMGGQDGADGLSAFEIWLAAGNEGTEADFLEWLRRPPTEVPNFTLTFENTDLECLVLPELTVVRELPEPEAREGYNFLGWYTDADFATPAIVPFIFIQDMTLYARWWSIVFTVVSAGSSHNLAIDADGGLWAWGGNWSGQLGDGTIAIHRPSPVRIKEGTMFSYISAGMSHGLAIDVDGGIWSWGRNWDGQLGDGTTVNRFSPVRIKERHHVFLYQHRV